jgi:uncharacterized protein (TIGR02466 family)
MILTDFNTPIYVRDVEPEVQALIQAEVETALPAMEKNRGGPEWNKAVNSTWSPRGNSDVATFLLSNLAQEITAATVDYLTEIKYTGMPLRLGASWVNWHDQGAFQFDHHHAWARVCGVYYYQTNEQDGNLRFSNPVSEVRAGLFPGDGVEPPAIFVTPKVGRLVLWPHWLQHRVEVNSTEHQRISINFNLD